MQRGMYIVIFVLLFTGWLLLFRRIRWLETASRVLRMTREGMDEAARRRLLENRKKLLTLQKDHSVWYRLEQELNYSGWKQKFPVLTAELWVAGNVLLSVLTAPVLLAGVGWRGMFAGLAGIL